MAISNDRSLRFAFKPPPRPEPSYPSAIVITLGPRSLRAGFPSPHAKGPRAIFLSAVGSPKASPDSPPTAFGYELYDHSDRYAVRFALSPSGEVSDWAALEALLSHALLSELRVSPDDHALLLAVPLPAYLAQREALAALLLGSLRVPHLRIDPEPPLSLGLRDGVLLDFGHSHTSVVPISRGRVLADRVARLPLHGAAVSALLRAALEAANPGVAITEAVLDAAKRSACALRPPGDAAEGPEFVAFEPQGCPVMRLGRERYAVPEMYLSGGALAEMLAQAAAALEGEDSVDVVLVGGAFGNTCERLAEQCAAVRPRLRFQRPYSMPYAPYGAAVNYAARGDAPENYFVSVESFDAEGPSAIFKQVEWFDL